MRNWATTPAGIGLPILFFFLALAPDGKTVTAAGTAAAHGREISQEGPPAHLDAGGKNTPVSADCAAKRHVAGYDVVLLMGQSNMSGRGEGYDPAIDGPNNPRIQQWSRANTIIPAEEHLQHHDDSGLGTNTNVGMGTAFGRAYVESLPAHRDVLLVPTAHGGTGLVDGPWSPGGYLFEDAVKRMEAALASGDEAAGNCAAAVLWHQGEADAGHRVKRDAYLSAWTVMIAALRSRVPATAEAPVVLGEFALPWAEQNRGKTAPILAAIRAVTDSVELTAVASADGLSVNYPGNVVHFDAAGQRDFGRRYFDKLGDAIGNDRVGVRLGAEKGSTTTASAIELA